MVDLDTGVLLGQHIQPLLARLAEILGNAKSEVDEIGKRIKIENVGIREFHLHHFQIIGSAVLRRKRLIIDYYARGGNTYTRREISPQRLVCYRGNWYLDAWCHLRQDIRNFSVDTIERVEILETKAKNIAEPKLNDALGSGYGIFGGRKIRWATLKFTPERARWVAFERWHPKQQSRLLEDGSHELRLPYTDDRELVMDILRHGAEVIVCDPMILRKRVAMEIDKMRMNYRYPGEPQ